MLAWMLLALSTVPLDAAARDSVDVIEVNHFYDEQGRLVFDQCIYYDWTPAACRHQVRGWRLIKSPNQLPRRDWAGGGYTAVWHEGDLLRVVRAGSVAETWTQYDPELLERENLPKERRRDLTTPLPAKPCPTP